MIHLIACIVQKAVYSMEKAKNMVCILKKMDIMVKSAIIIN